MTYECQACFIRFREKGRCPSCGYDQIRKISVLCRNCTSWESIPPWQGNCTTHPWDKPQWSETRSPSSDCEGRDFKDKYEKYVEAK